MPRLFVLIDVLCWVGVLVVVGVDNVQDPFNLVGCSDLLETVVLLVMVGY